MLIIHFIFLLVILFGGMYFYGKYTNPKILETLENNDKPRCPNLLIQFGSKFYLYNSNIQKVPGVNPIEFNNLEDYTDFLKWQQNVGIKCPVLYVQNTYDAQGNRVYKIRPSVTEPQGGLPPSVVSNNSNILNEVDTRVINAAFPDTVSSVNTSADITKLDNTKSDNKKVHENDTKFSNLNIQYPESLQPIERKFTVLDDDPMNHTWGGKEHTENSVREGKYAGSEVMHY